MRIVQIIDSLEIGGAEKMAVNYANALLTKIEFSGLVATRAEGKLKSELDEKVSYLFLNRKRIIDFGAVLRLRKYCKENNIDFIQAHGTSYFIAILVKFVYPKVKIVWHEHFGARHTENINKNTLLLFCSYFFKGIVVVNKSLEEWCKLNLRCNNITLLNNFTLNKVEVPCTILKGFEGKKIVCIANLKYPKNHSFLVEIANKILKKYPDWSFHLIGKDFLDDYSNQLKAQIRDYKLNDSVFIYGSKNDIFHILKQSDIAILTSISEGLPVSVIEYGLMKKPVVLTKVGEIPFIIKDGIEGFLVDSNDIDLFYEKLINYIQEEDLRTQMGNALYQIIIDKHSEKYIIANYLNWVTNL
ncbi:glycosyltransferase [Flavobacterium sp.]|jgi:glycosyltransferase involved in cell wall biosynthesis|uniref:glycosyltransferase n=1 Tax=Flavobacterium sp. TaxID=239 RepID=UPI0037C08B65